MTDVMHDPRLPSLLDAKPGDLLVASAPIPSDSAEPMLKTSIRLPLALHEWAKEEAERRGMGSWSELVRSLLEAERKPVGDDQVVSVGDLRRILSQLARPAEAA